MTKTRASQTITPTTTPDGRDGFRITCDCATHKGTSGAAIVAFPIAASRVHGTVTMAHHPAHVIRKSNATKGIWKA